MTHCTVYAPTTSALFVAAAIHREHVLVMTAASGFTHFALGLVLVMVPGTAVGRVAVLAPEGSLP